MFHNRIEDNAEQKNYNNREYLCLNILTKKAN